MKLIKGVGGASPSLRGWRDETRPSPPALMQHLDPQWRLSGSHDLQVQKWLARQEAQIHQSVGVGPSICWIGLLGSHRQGLAQSGYDHLRSCRILS